MSISTATIQTTTDGWHTFATVSLGDVTVVRVEGVCKVTGSSNRGYVKKGWIYTSVSTDLLDAYSFVDDEDYDIRLDGSNLQVQGKASTTIDWTIRYWTITP